MPKYQIFKEYDNLSPVSTDKNDEVDICLIVDNTIYRKSYVPVRKTDKIEFQNIGDSEKHHLFIIFLNDCTFDLKFDDDYGLSFRKKKGDCMLLSDYCTVENISDNSEFKIIDLFCLDKDNDYLIMKYQDQLDKNYIVSAELLRDKEVKKLEELFSDDQQIIEYTESNLSYEDFKFFYFNFLNGKEDVSDEICKEYNIDGEYSLLNDEEGKQFVSCNFEVKDEVFRSILLKIDGQEIFEHKFNGAGFTIATYRSELYNNGNYCDLCERKFDKYSPNKFFSDYYYDFDFDLYEKSFYKDDQNISFRVSKYDLDVCIGCLCRVYKSYLENNCKFGNKHSNERLNKVFQRGDGQKYSGESAKVVDILEKNLFQYIKSHKNINIFKILGDLLDGKSFDTIDELGHFGDNECPYDCEWCSDQYWDSVRSEGTEVQFFKERKFMNLNDFKLNRDKMFNYYILSGKIPTDIINKINYCYL